MSDDRLAHSLSQVPLKSIILLELLHEAGCGHHADYSLILRVVGHRTDRLDTALIRPGRVDIVEYIGQASYSQAFRLFKQFYPDLSDTSSLPIQFANAVKSSRCDVSMAALQGYLLLYKQAPESAVEHVDKFINTNEVMVSSQQQLEDEYDTSLHDSIKPRSTGTKSDIHGVEDVTRRTTKRKPVTAFELDKMFFNPQKGSALQDYSMSSQHSANIDSCMCDATTKHMIQQSHATSIALCAALCLSLHQITDAHREQQQQQITAMTTG
eukprot:20217-Heterococcus_DN1.PRE.2